MNKNKTNEELFKTVIVTGKIQKVGYYSDIVNKRKQPAKYHVNLELDETPENEAALDEIAKYVFDGQKNFLPKWYENLRMDGVYPKYINTKSNYDIDVKLPSGEKTHIDEMNATYEVNRGAKCKLKIIMKKGTAIYPFSLYLEDFGEPFDPFEGM